MRVQPTQPTKPTFLGYNCRVKTLYKKGLLPQLKKDFYGREIKSLDDATTEHIIPHSKGGKTRLDNTVIATAESNQLRSDSPLKDFIDFEAMGEYFDVFRNRVIEGLDGNKYIAGIMKSVSECLERGL